MKTMLRTISYSVLLATPFLLNGCDTMNNIMGSSNSPDYTYSQPAPHTTFRHSTTNPNVRKSETTRLVEPHATYNTGSNNTSSNSTGSSSQRTAASTVNSTTSSASSAAASVPVNGPAVPSMAPSVSQ